MKQTKCRKRSYTHVYATFLLTVEKDNQPQYIPEGFQLSEVDLFICPWEPLAILLFAERIVAVTYLNWNLCLL
jgi:hypothetical protein